MTAPRGYLEVNESERPPLDRELGSSFTYNDLFGGLENGKLFVVPSPNYEDYNEMLETDGKAAELSQMLINPILSAAWEIEASKDDPSDEITNFVQHALTALPQQGGMRTPVELVVAQMSRAMIHQRTYFNKVFKLNDDGMVVYDKLAWRPPQTCELALDHKSGDLRGFRQTPVEFGPFGPHLNGNKGWIDIPMDQAFVYIHGRWQDPLYGISSMKVPYWCYITKRKLRWLWYQFLDQTYLPKTVVKNPDELKARSDAKKVSTLRSRGIVGLSSDTTVEAFESSGRGAEGYLQAIRFLESEMSHSILAGFTDLTSAAAEGKGSYALSESQGKLFLRTRRMVAEDMARQVTQGVIGDLVKFNFGAKASVPTFAFGPLSEQNERDVLEMFRSVATTGAKVPPEFYDELTVRVASLLELREDKVREQLNEMPETPGDLGHLQQQVGIATEMVKGAQASGQAPPARGGPAPGPKPKRNNPSGGGRDSVANGGRQPR